jgi:cytoskeletal protein RodZ
MKNTYLLIAVAVLVILGIVFFKGSTPSDVQKGDTMMDKEGTSAESVIVALAAQNASGESGSATFAEVDGKVKVTIKLDGTPAGVAQPAHVHMGSCPNPTDVKYPLTAVTNGMSETMLDVSMKDLLAQLPLAVNVHKSADELQKYVACGNIVSSETMMDKKEGDAMMDKDGAMMEGKVDVKVQPE